MAAEIASNKMPAIARRRRGRKKAKKQGNSKKLNGHKIQQISFLNREEEYDESSGSESDEWYEGDEFDEFAFNEGGYYRVVPGDVMKQRYVMKKRLGWGHFSQVYLAWDKQKEMHVAMKIQKTGEDYIDAGNEEVSYHNALNATEKDREEENISAVCRMLESFEIYSNRGKHIVMVFETMSFALYDLLFVNEDYDAIGAGFPLGIAKAIVREMLVGLTELHESKLVHTDLKPENVMLNSFQAVDDEALSLHKQIFDFKQMKVDCNNSKKKLERGGLSKNQKKRLKQKIKKLETKISNNLHLLAMDENKDDATKERELNDGLLFMGQSVIDNQPVVKIVDLGTASWVTDKNDYEIGTRNYRPPECILGFRFGTPLDVWAVGCMVVELVSGELLFDPDEEEEEREEDFDNEQRNAVHLKQIMATFGRMPKHLQSKKYFNRKGELLLEQRDEFRGLQDLVDEKVGGHLDEADSELVCAFLKRLLEVDPRKRITATEALELPWLEITEADREEIRQWMDDIEHRDEDEEDEEEEENDEEDDEEEEEVNEEK